MGNCIIFDKYMARALHLGLKTVTRRSIKTKIPISKIVNQSFDETGILKVNVEFNDGSIGSISSKFKLNEKLWVREPASVVFADLDRNILEFFYQADAIESSMYDSAKRYSIPFPHRFSHFPKWIKERQGVPNGCIKEMHRHTIVISNIEIQQLKNISLFDVAEEGIESQPIDGGAAGYIYGINLNAVDCPVCELDELEAFKNLWKTSSSQDWDPEVFIFKYSFIILL